MIQLRLAVALMCVISMPTSVYAVPENGLVARCGGPYGKCGFVDKATGQSLIPAIYEVVEPFSEGLAAVRLNGLFGYIDATGKTVIAPQFQAAGGFLEGYAEVRIEGASGIVDRTGKLVVPNLFRSITPFTKGTFIAEPLPPGFTPAHPQGTRLASRIDQLGGGPAGIYHLTRGWLTETNLKFAFFDNPSRGLIWAAIQGREGADVWGLMRADGGWQVSPRYGHVQALIQNRAIVGGLPDSALPRREAQEAVRRGAVDENGKLVVPLKFANLSYWRGGYGTAYDVKTTGTQGQRNMQKVGIVRPDGALLGDRWFDELEISEDGRLPRARLGDVWHGVEPDGRLVADQRGPALLADCPGGLRIIQRTGGVEVQRPDGTRVGVFDDGLFQARNCHGPFQAQRSAKWFIILENGSILGGKDGFDNTYPFSGRHAAVQVDGKWGIIDRSGSFTVTPRFAKLTPDLGNTFAVGEGDRYWINATGKTVSKPHLPRPSPSQGLQWPGGLHFKERQGLWGLSDDRGKPVVAARYRALSCFYNGTAWAAAPGAKEWCPIGPDGRAVKALACVQTHYPYYLSEHSPEQFSPDAFENSVLWARAWLDYQAGKRANPPRWVSRYEARPLRKTEGSNFNR